jgi:hypothetical protein
MTMPYMYVPPETDTAEEEQTVMCRECDRTGVEDEGPYYITHRSPVDAPNGYYCDYCLNYCDECDAHFVDSCGTRHHDEYDDYCECEACQSRSERVHDYSYQPYPVFHGQGPVFLGLELEVSTPWNRTNDCAELADDSLGSLGYLKEDSSIGTGFEMVCHPMTYDYAVERYPWQMLHRLKSHGAEASEDCGMHVHVSRDAFDGPSHVYRWMKLFYRNEDKVKHVARRNSHQWASFHGEDRQHQKEIAKGNRTYYMPRYVAINTNNDATFEVRVFASSLETREVKAALALVDASVEYTRTLTSHDVLKHNGWSWDTFIAWLPDKYAALKEEMEGEQFECVY